MTLKIYTECKRTEDPERNLDVAHMGRKLHMATGGIVDPRHTGASQNATEKVHLFQ